MSRRPAVFSSGRQMSRFFQSQKDVIFLPTHSKLKLSTVGEIHTYKLGQLTASHKQGAIAEGEADEEVRVYILWTGRSKWPRGLRSGSTAARLMGLRVRIPPEEVFCECCVLSGRGLCVGPITRAEESYRLWCV